MSRQTLSYKFDKSDCLQVSITKNDNDGVIEIHHKRRVLFAHNDKSMILKPCGDISCRAIFYDRNGRVKNAEKRVTQDKILYNEFNRLFDELKFRNSTKWLNGQLEDESQQCIVDLMGRVEHDLPVLKGSGMFVDSHVTPRSLKGTLDGIFVSIAMDKGVLKLTTRYDKFGLQYHSILSLPSTGAMTLQVKSGGFNKDDSDFTIQRDMPELYGIVEAMYEKLCTFDEAHRLKGELSVSSIRHLYKFLHQMVMTPSALDRFNVPMPGQGASL
ncbi:MAG: hypothetical protein ACOYNL_07425 [Rickettsiales bacterium]